MSSALSVKAQPVILLCGHMDTVAGHLPLRIEEGKIYARGAVDAKGPLAAMIMAAVEAAKEPGFKGEILVAALSRKKPPAEESSTLSLRASKRTTLFSVNQAVLKT